uniref:Store-operated calcium entry-associated regulatory factor n=1 Tax=Haptolina brevifila TaxID=156173 RepID=A0A7S2CM44_9EUKA|mmetsp:Transcript_26297/g.52782  ORF Transcript_26297/g.52782 Transcript_26297/m.52782 type:complete len:179 (+) Transcript_26297:74-610(+)
MWTAALLVLISAEAVASFTLTAKLVSSTRAPCMGRVSPAQALLPPEAFSVPTEAFLDPQATAAGDFAVADILTSVMLCAIAFKMIGGGSDTAGGESEDRVSEFGWLHADMRIPLPTLADLRLSCHLIGQHDGHHMYLCSSRQPSDSMLGNCELSEDFTAYYGAEVFVCQGSKDEMIRS